MALHLSLRFLALGLLTIPSIVAATNQGGGTPALPKIPAIVADDTQLEILHGALKRTGLDLVLKGSGPFTLLAPTDGVSTRVPRIMIRFKPGMSPSVKTNKQDMDLISSPNRF